MDETKVVNVRIESYDKYIGRPSKFGNPFYIGADGTRDEVVEKYKGWLYDQIEEGEITKDDIDSLKGKKLGCYCAPKRCHGDVLLELINVSDTFDWEGVSNARNNS